MHLQLIMYSYTLYFVLLISFAQVFSYDIPDDAFDKITLECMEKVKIDKEFVKKIVDADFRMAKGNPKVNEHVECLAKSKKVVNEDGTLNRDVIYKEIVDVFLPLLNKTKDKEVIANKIMDECMDVQHDSLAEQMINMHNCLVDAAHKH
ncbi:hypothetical protein RN001_000013 [Aquatica leii]|uniref:Uncharacterized protein n=1 Tax=Aquatica leii TaxID=1421715 RepID=A0AAN7SIZ3_9COLE|nr:hypothetical protein RN001_000013 [Aquatica leii]